MYEYILNELTSSDISYIWKQIKGDAPDRLWRIASNADLFGDQLRPDGILNLKQVEKTVNFVKEFKDRFDDKLAEDEKRILHFCLQTVMNFMTKTFIEENKEELLTILNLNEFSDNLQIYQAFEQKYTEFQWKLNIDLKD